MHSVSFFKGPVNTVRVKRGVGKQRKWGSFQHIMSQSMLQPSVKMCHIWNIHFPLFQWTRSQRHIQPVFLGFRFGKCISGCGVPVHRRHPSPLSGGSDKRGRRRVRPLLSSSSNPPTTKRHRDAFSIIYHWYFDEKILQLCYGRWTFLLVLIHEQAMNVQMWIISRILGMTKSREVKDRRNLALPKAPESN